MAVNPGELAAKTASTGDHGDSGHAAFDPEALVTRVDALLSSDAEGNDEAELLEKAHRLINDAMEGR
ncbi:hypothetical protein [Corynebacterium glyciniphilum]|uniref:hypothetical protein n=1 Tax=Corynebacterium glyciniphilum TaxID=1404244 RepID=UPI00264ADC3A|nr:hypothetical protein [Corynebacterium glyciniphilum]MDN5683089.1 hypothetical protein [Corynebacterium glyciniphilum]MDN6706525.1 hypothetical protein [Corynebacterium glyciniphilum]